MPNLIVEMFEGRTIDQRRVFAAEVTETFTRVLGGRPEDVHIIFRELSPELVSNGGVLASEDPKRAELLASFGRQDETTSG